MIIRTVGMATNKVAMEMMVLKWMRRGIVIITVGLEITQDLYYKSMELCCGSYSLVHDALLGPF